MRIIQRTAFLLAIGLAGPTILPTKAADAGDGPKVVIDEVNLAKLAPAEQQRVLAIKDRLETITAMDRSSLSKEERRALRAEMKGIKEEMKVYNQRGTVIYLSTAGIIIIVLLLIILL